MLRSRWTRALLAAALLTGAGPAAAEDLKPEEPCAAVPIPKAQEQKMRALGKASVSERLRDPPSARFGPTKFAVVRCQNGQWGMACGTVNAKNAFGGYTGPKAWIVLSDGEEKVVWSQDQVGPYGESPLWPFVAQCEALGK